MQIGQIVEQYQVIESIGQGGMGEVFLAQHTQTGELVAIKTILKEALDRERTVLERVRREGEALQRAFGPTGGENP